MFGPHGGRFGGPHGFGFGGRGMFGPHHGPGMFGPYHRPMMFGGGYGYRRGYGGGGCCNIF